MGGKRFSLPFAVGIVCFPLWGLEVNKQFSADISLTGVYQYADFSKNAAGNTGKGSVAADIGCNFHPTDRAKFRLPSLLQVEMV